MVDRGEGGRVPTKDVLEPFSYYLSKDEIKRVRKAVVVHVTRNRSM